MIDIAQLALDCAPDIPATLIIAIANQESRNNPFAIGHPSVPTSKQPQTAKQAYEMATSLAEQGQRYDLGLMQISSANFGWLGLDNQTALDPCNSIKAARQVIIEGLKVEGKDLSSVFNTLSRYNTGNNKYGYQNGYVAAVTSRLLSHANANQSSSQEIRIYEGSTTIDDAPNEDKVSSSWQKIGNTQGLFSTAKQNNNGKNLFAPTPQHGTAHKASPNVLP